MKNPLKIGHRGAKGHIAENTLESIEKAIKLGVDAIEIDVHKCRTGELVVIHDFTLDRTTNGEGEVARKTLEQLQLLKVENQFKIPTLVEVLELIEGKCSINIELKGSNTATETCSIIEKYVSGGKWQFEDFIVSSFQKKELFKVFDINKKIPIGVLSKASIIEAVEVGKKLEAKAIHPSIGIITRENVKQTQQEGFQVNVWTVNDPVSIQRMKDFGVDGIISDFPELL